MIWSAPDAGFLVFGGGPGCAAGEGMRGARSLESNGIKNVTEECHIIQYHIIEYNLGEH